MPPFGDRVPRWPPLAGVAALVVAAVVAGFAPLPAAVPALIAGAERTSPGIVLLGALLASAGIVVAVVRIARLTRPVSPAQFGLRTPDSLGRALLLTAAAGLVLAAVAAAWAALGDVEGPVAVPPELDTRSLTAQIRELPLREPPAFGPGLLASALGRCVLGVVAGELLLRGFAFPALAGWKGPLPAALIVAVLFGGVAQLFGASGTAVLSMLLGLLLCGLYVATGSLLGGIALAAATSAVALGASVALPAGQIALLAVLCAGAAVALAAAPALQRLGGARRAELRGSAA